MERIHVKISSRSFVVILFYRLMASGKFRVILLLIGIMASSLLMEYIRSKVWQFVQGTFIRHNLMMLDTVVEQTYVFVECLHWPYLTNNIMSNNIMMSFDSISKVDLMQSAIKIGKQVRNSFRPEIRFVFI